MNNEETRNGPTKTFYGSKNDLTNLMQVLPKSYPLKGSVDSEEHVLEINKHLLAYLIQGTYARNGIKPIHRHTHTHTHTHSLPLSLSTKHRILQC